MSLDKVTKELFLEILEVLDEKLEENKLKLSLNIYGGTVMMTCFDARPATKDIDAIFETSPLIENILLVGRRYLGERQKIFLNYVGKDLGKSWKEFSI